METDKTRDLWPQDLLAESQIPGPVAILREQAALLGRKTRNLIEADVTKVALAPYSNPFDKCDEEVAARFGRAGLGPRYAFNYAFDLVAPALGDFRYRLFLVHHDVPQYPTMFDLDSEFIKELGFISGSSGFVEAANEGEFVSILREILRSRRTREVIRTLQAQIEPRMPGASG